MLGQGAALVVNGSEKGWLLRLAFSLLSLQGSWGEFLSNPA